MKELEHGGMCGRQNLSVKLDGLLSSIQPCTRLNLHKKIYTKINRSLTEDIKDMNEIKFVLQTERRAFRNGKERVEIYYIRIITKRDWAVKLKELVSKEYTNESMPG